MEKKIIRMAQVEKKISLKKTAIYEMVTNGAFPKPFPIGTHSKGWLESDVDEWISRRAGKLPENDEPSPPAKVHHPTFSAPPMAEMLKAPLGTELLRPDEITRITGHKSESDQVKWLTDNRWQFHTNGKGEVIIGRMYARLKMCGIDLRQIETI